MEELGLLERLITWYGPFAAMAILAVWFLWKKLSEKDQLIKELNEDHVTMVESLVEKTTGALNNNTNALREVAESNKTLSHYVHEALVKK